MWPWGHLGVAYLAYRLGLRPDDRQVHGLPAIAAVVGSQIPDLVDKPLAWWGTVLPTGRSLAHSGLTWLVVTIALLAILARHRRTVVLAFSIGYGIHLLTDGLYPAIGAEWGQLTYLLWPVLPSPEYSTAQSFLAHFAQFRFASTTLFEFGLFAIALAWAGYTELDWSAWSEVGVPERDRR
jgi:hypothetical protein